MKTKLENLIGKFFAPLVIRCAIRQQKCFNYLFTGNMILLEK